MVADGFDSFPDEMDNTFRLRILVRSWRPQSLCSVWLEFYIILVCFLLFPVL